jgi:hypothetical protein
MWPSSFKDYNRPNSSSYTTSLIILSKSNSSPITTKWSPTVHLLLLFWPYSQMRPNSSPCTTFLTLLPNEPNSSSSTTFLTIVTNEAQQFIQDYFSDHTPKWGPTVHSVLLFWPYSQTRPSSLSSTTLLTILKNEAQQFTLYYFSDHTPKWGPTVHPRLLFWPYSQMRPNSSPYSNFLTILPNEAQQSTPYYFPDHTPKWGPRLCTLYYFLLLLSNDQVLFLMARWDKESTLKVCQSSATLINTTTHPRDVVCKIWKKIYPVVWKIWPRNAIW